MIYLLQTVVVETKDVDVDARITVTVDAEIIHVMDFVETPPAAIFSGSSFSCASAEIIITAAADVVIMVETAAGSL